MPTTSSIADSHRQTPVTDCVLTVSCVDQPGILYAMSKFVAEHRGNVVESQQFCDREGGRLFMRTQFEPDGEGPLEIDTLRVGFADVAADFGMTWRLDDSAEKQRVLIMVSKYGHCLNDLLFRVSIGWLNIEVVAVVSNHPDLGSMADNYGVRFRHIPVNANNKPAAEAQLLELVDELNVNLVVLARYMQILSPDLSTKLDGRVINIHHSMLPSFKGAGPYIQAHDRGVKIIGATAHYVTPDLDEGPIIEQQVARVDHSMTADDVTALGRDTECLALAHAVHWHTERRVLLDGKRTVVFP